MLNKNDLYDRIISLVDELDYELADYGVCFNCGALSETTEPDAQGYWCNNCGEYEVNGLELAALEIL